MWLVATTCSIQMQSNQSTTPMDLSDSMFDPNEDEAKDDEDEDDRRKPAAKK